MTSKRNNKIAIMLLIGFILYHIPYISVCIVSFFVPQNRATNPTDFEDGKWVCESPNMYFICKSELDIYGNSKEKNEGVIFIDGEEQEIEVFFNFGGLATFTYKDDGTLISAYFNGDIVMIDEEKCVIEVDKEKDEIFNGQYDKIIFVRMPLD